MSYTCKICLFILSLLLLSLLCWIAPALGLYMLLGYLSLTGVFSILLSLIFGVYCMICIVDGTAWWLINWFGLEPYFGFSEENPAPGSDIHS